MEGAPRIQAEGASEHKGDLAREAIIVGALAVSDLVKTTLGPKGMDKILQSASSPDGAITITNDGATILKSVAVDNAAAKILIEIAQVQDREVGDGTTSVCVLAGELLRQAERLLAQKLHPQTIIDGWREATNVAHDALQAATIDHGNDEKALRTDLMNIARTTLSSKVLSDHKDFFANMAVDAVLRLKGKIDLEAIHIVKKPGGSLRDSFLDEGFILDKQIGVRQPKRIENARILVANTPMDTDKVKIYGMQVKTDSVEKVAALEKAEKAKMENKCERILAHNINVFVNRQLIYNQAEQIFAKNGVMAIEHADFDGIERLALVTGGDIVSTFDSPDKVRLGECKLIEEIMIGEDRLIHFSGVALGEACTVVLRGASMHILDEAERSLHDALCVVSQAVHETRTTFGGGCAESIMAKAVDELAAKTSGKKQLAMEAFARALRQLPSIIADNAGFDATQLVSELRAAHSQGQSTAGIDLDKGEIGDMQSLGITESFKVKQQVLLSAAEAAEMVLRVDDLIRCAPRQREDMHH